MKANLEITSHGVPLGCHAFPNGARVEIKFTVSDACCEKAWFYLGNDERVLIAEETEVQGSENSFRCLFELDTNKLPSPDGLYFCHFEYVSNGNRYYTAFDDANKCYLETHFVNETQILVYDEKYAFPQWLSCGVMYQIFPDRFARGGDVTRRDDAVYNEDWDGIPEYPQKRGDAFPNNTHFGGTLYGVAEKIDYLSSLGVNCIYLNPIFEAYSNHKYDTADFLSVDRTFGGDKALSAVIESPSSSVSTAMANSSPSATVCGQATTWNGWLSSAMMFEAR